MTVGLFPGVGAFLYPDAATSVDFRNITTVGALVAQRVNYIRALGAKGAVSALRVLVGVAAGNLELGVYTNLGSGALARPGTLKATTGTVACPTAGIGTIPLLTTVNIAPGDWLAVLGDNVATTLGRSASLASALFPEVCQVQTGQATLPVSASGSPNSSTLFWISS